MLLGNLNATWHNNQYRHCNYLPKLTYVSAYNVAMLSMHINFTTDSKVNNIINSLHAESKSEREFSLISVIYQQSNDLYL